jgi:hypothetical protein
VNELASDREFHSFFAIRPFPHAMVANCLATKLDLWSFSGKLRGSVFNPLFKLNWLNQLNGWDPSGRVSRLTHLASLTFDDLGIY